MPRPCMEPGKKRKAVSITVRQDVMALAEATGNKSQFFEQAVFLVKEARKIIDDALVIANKIEEERSVTDMNDFLKKSRIFLRGKK